jgi:hypothetical protein
MLIANRSPTNVVNAHRTAWAATSDRGALVSTGPRDRRVRSAGARQNPEARERHPNQPERADVQRAFPEGQHAQPHREFDADQHPGQRHDQQARERPSLVGAADASPRASTTP